MTMMMMFEERSQYYCYYYYSLMDQSTGRAGGLVMFTHILHCRLSVETLADGVGGIIME